MVCLAAKADVPVFGNMPDGVDTFSVGYSGDNMVSGAFGFTPQDNLDVNSVTLWLSGYSASTLQYMVPSVGIYSNQFVLAGPGMNEPNVNAQLASLNGPAPNDGSSAAFTFSAASGPIQLEANEEYWIWIRPEILGPFPTNGGANVLLESGGPPTGDATYNEFEMGEFGISSDAFTPAFTINVIPEPSEYALIGTGAVLVGFRRWRKWQRAV